MEAGLHLNRDKCTWAAASVKFLGHQLDATGITPLRQKVEDIGAIPMPVTKVDLQCFLGCVNFYHRFVPRIATILSLIHI